MSNLLETIKENNEGFNVKEFEKILGGFCWYEDGGNGGYTFEDVNGFIKSHITKSRIKELEVLVEMIEGEKDNWNGSGEYYANVSEALQDVIQTLQSTIKELKN